MGTDALRSVLVSSAGEHGGPASTVQVHLRCVGHSHWVLMYSRECWFPVPAVPWANKNGADALDLLLIVFQSIHIRYSCTH